MSDLRREIKALRKLVLVPRCPSCSWWSTTETTICADDGTCLRPEVCPDCQRVVPIRDRLVIADVDLDLL